METSSIPSGRPIVMVVPIGAVPTDLLQGLLPPIEARFPGRAARLAARGLPHPADAYVPQRRQYRAEPLLERLAALEEHAERVLGVADLDLFVPGLNFVFGLAQPGGRACLVAIARLRPEFWGGRPDPELLLARSVKEAIHELGHSYGLQHCQNRACVMWFSNTLVETDQKSDRFGPEHAAWLRRALDGAG